LGNNVIDTAQIQTIRRDGFEAGRQPIGSGGSRIVAILPRGEAIRNFVYTGALDEAARSSDVTLLSVVPNDDLGAMLTSRYGKVFQLSAATDRWIVAFLREILDMAHGRWLWSEAARERWRLRDAEAASGARMKRCLKKLTCYPFANRAGLEFLSGLENASSRLLRTTNEYVRLFEELKPSLVFNASHVHSHVATYAVRAAQWLGIPTATFIFSWDNLTSQGRIIPQYDYYLVWSEGLRKQLLGMYRSIRQEQVFVTGTPQFDFHFRPEFRWTREEFCKRVDADPARNIVLYTTGMANHMPGEPAIVERIASMLRELTELGAPQLLVRVYPKDQTRRFEDIKRRYPEVLLPAIPWESNWLTPLIEDSYLLTNMLRHSAVCINVASTISLEMCMFDKPVINVGYNPPDVDPSVVDYARYYEFDHYRPIVESGAVEVARSEEDLRLKLIAALLHPERQAMQRRSLVRRFFGNSLDGWSSTRVAGVLDALAARPHQMK
jgi:hypothetical protein